MEAPLEDGTWRTPAFDTFSLAGTAKLSGVQRVLGATLDAGEVVAAARALGFEGPDADARRYLHEAAMDRLYGEAASRRSLDDAVRGFCASIAKAIGAVAARELENTLATHGACVDALGGLAEMIADPEYGERQANAWLRCFVDDLPQKKGLWALAFLADCPTSTCRSSTRLAPHLARRSRPPQAVSEIFRGIFTKTTIAPAPLGEARPVSATPDATFLASWARASATFAGRTDDEAPASVHLEAALVDLEAAITCARSGYFMPGTKIDGAGAAHVLGALGEAFLHHASNYVSAEVPVVDLYPYWERAFGFESWHASCCALSTDCLFDHVRDPCPAEAAARKDRERGGARQWWTRKGGARRGVVRGAALRHAPWVLRDQRSKLPWDSASFFVELARNAIEEDLDTWLDGDPLSGSAEHARVSERALTAASLFFVTYFATFTIRRARALVDRLADPTPPAMPWPEQAALARDHWPKLTRLASTDAAFKAMLSALGAAKDKDASDIVDAGSDRLTSGSSAAAHALLASRRVTPARLVSRHDGIRGSRSIVERRLAMRTRPATAAEREEQRFEDDRTEVANDEAWHDDEACRVCFAFAAELAPLDDALRKNLVLTLRDAHVGRPAASAMLFASCAGMVIRALFSRGQTEGLVDALEDMSRRFGWQSK